MKFIITIITKFISSKYRSITTLFLKLICDSSGVDLFVEGLRLFMRWRYGGDMVVIGQNPGRKLQGGFLGSRET